MNARTKTKQRGLARLRELKPIFIKHICVSRRWRGHRWRYRMTITPKPPPGVLTAKFMDDMVEISFHRHGEIGQYVVYPGLRLMSMIATR